MKRRSRVLAAIGWLFIVVGAGGLFSHFRPLFTSDFTRGFAWLRSEPPADVALLLTLEMVAIVGGAALLGGGGWGRWLLAGWMAFHVVVSAFHSAPQLLIHCVIFAPILYLLFTRSAH